MEVARGGSITTGGYLSSVSAYSLKSAIESVNVDMLNLSVAVSASGKVLLSGQAKEEDLKSEKFF